jgi:uncharacterized protein YndB with AHSA1/START domain
MTDLPFSLDREIVIRATRATVFRYFTDTERFAAWWGAGSRIDPRVGGEVFIQYPGGFTAQGTITELTPPSRIVFTYGYDRPDPPIPIDGSRVTITVEEVAGGTRVVLHHDVATAAIRDAHRRGWRYQMSIFGDVVSRDQHAAAPALVERWLGAWSSSDTAARLTTLRDICTPDVEFRDKWGYTQGLDDLADHIDAARMHLPAALVADAPAEHAHGVALVRWHAMKDGATEPAARGTTVFDLAPDGRIARATGLWS